MLTLFARRLLDIAKRPQEYLKDDECARVTDLVKILKTKKQGNTHKAEATQVVPKFKRNGGGKGKFNPKGKGKKGKAQGKGKKGKYNPVFLGEGKAQPTNNNLLDPQGPNLGGGSATVDTASVEVPDDESDIDVGDEQS